jgi:MFS family permease
MSFQAPDGGWGWIVVLSSLLIHLIMDGLTYSMGQFLPVLITDLEATRTQASVIHALLPAVTLGCGPIGSTLTNRYGCRWTTLIGSFIAAIGFALSFFATSIYMLYVTIGCIVGLGFGLIYVPAIVSVGYYFEKKRSIAMGIAVCGSGLGTFLFPPINRALMNSFGWRATFLIHAGFTLNCCVCAALLRPLPIEPSEILKKKRKLEGSIRRKEQELKSINNDNSTEIKLEQNVKHPFLNIESSAAKLNKSMELIAKLREDEDAIREQNNLFKSNKSLNVFAQTLAQSSNNLNHEQQHQQQYKPVNTKENEETSSSSLDFKLLLNILFIFFALSNFLTSLGFNAPYIFTNDQAKSNGLSEQDGDYALQAIGIANTIGRVILGILSNISWFNRLYLYSTVISICGLATLIQPFIFSRTVLLLYGFVFGFTSGKY